MNESQKKYLRQLECVLFFMYKQSSKHGRRLVPCISDGDRHAKPILKDALVTASRFIPGLRKTLRDLN